MKKQILFQFLAFFLVLSGCKKDDNTQNTSSTTIQTLGCSSVTYSSTFTKGVVTNNVIASIPYTGGNGGKFSKITINSTGVTGLVATANADSVANGNGVLKLSINGTPSDTGTAIFNISLGGQSCSFKAIVTGNIVGKTFKWKIDGVLKEATSSFYATKAPTGSSITLTLLASGGVYANFIIQNFTGLGTYQIGGAGANNFNIATLGSGDYQNAGSSSNGSLFVTVNSYTTTNIKGIFSGTIQNSNNPATYGTVTAGVFDLNF